ncbi:MAG: protease inhibitor I42 family protein [Proteobacteria bacterium]|nr:protease inhibitor I42 family protein [Pseudomonadota bacterium]
MLIVSVGVPFDVPLNSTPTTGYLWELPSSPVGVELLGSDFKQGPAAAMGDGGTQVFHLRANTSGSYKLNFQLKRRWESTPIETMEVEVKTRN